MTTFINDIQITESAVAKDWYDLTTARGKHIQVVFMYGKVRVKSINASAKVAAYPGASYGRSFADLPEAVETFKNKDTKQALRVLLSHLIESA